MLWTFPSKLILKHRAIAIKIPSYAVCKIPNPEEMSEFFDEVEKFSREIGIKGPSRVVFWAEFSLDENDISAFMKLSVECGYPTSLIFEGTRSSATESSLQENTIVAVNVDVDLSDRQKRTLADYLVKCWREHRFPQIELEETKKIIAEEKTFLPIVYRSLDPARRSINRIVQEEFNSISNLEVKTSISFCAMSSCLELEMPVAILKKALNRQFEKVFTYPEIYDIITERAKAFLKISTDIRTNDLVSIYHSLIAKHIIELLGVDRADEMLFCMAATADIRSRIEAEFIGSILTRTSRNQKGELPL